MTDDAHSTSASNPYESPSVEEESSSSSSGPMPVVFVLFAIPGIVAAVTCAVTAAVALLYLVLSTLDVEYSSLGPIAPSKAMMLFTRALFLGLLGAVIGLIVGFASAVRALVRQRALVPIIAVLHATICAVLFGFWAYALSFVTWLMQHFAPWREPSMREWVLLQLFPVITSGLVGLAYGMFLVEWMRSRVNRG